MKRLFAVLLLLSLLVGCDLSTATPPAPTETPDGPGATQTPSATPGVPTLTQVPTTNPDATPTPEVGTPVPVTENLFVNPAFNGGDRPVIGGYFVWGWDSYGCNREFIGHQCESPRQGTGNPVGLEDRLPEWSTAQDWQDPFRQHSSPTSGKWFCFNGTCHAGIYQVIQTVPGVPCIAGGYVQSASDNGVTGDPHQSWLAGPDQIANSAWQILTQAGGSSDAFNAEMEAQREVAPVFRNTYDHFEQIEISFTPTSWQTTIFFENVRLWPYSFNDNYIDDAYAFCGSGLEPSPPPADPPAPDITQPPPAENDPLVTPEKGQYTAFGSQNIRSDHCTGGACQVVGGVGVGQTTKYYGYWTDPNNANIWLCLDEENARWVQNQQFPLINIWQCGEWAAYKLGNTTYGTLTVGGW